MRTLNAVYAFTAAWRVNSCAVLCFVYHLKVVWTAWRESLITIGMGTR